MNASDGNGEPAAAWFELYANSLLKYGLQITNDRELVRDVIQEVFISIWRNAHPEISSVKNYLFVSFRRRLLRSIKEQRRRKEFDEKTPRLEEEISSPLEMGIHQENQAHLRLSVRALLNGLPARQREIIFLRFYEELEYDEIARIMDLGYQSTRNLLFKALKNLRGEAEQHRHLKNMAFLTLLSSAF